MKKPKHSTWVKQYIRTDTDMIQNESQWYELIRAAISRWTSVNSVSHNAGSLSTQFITFLGIKIKSRFFIAFSLNYVTISTNNKIRNENPASTGSLAGSKRFFFYIPFVYHAHEQTNLLHQSRHVEIDAAGSRPGFRQKKSKACRKHVANPHELVENLAANLVENHICSQVCSWLEWCNVALRNCWERGPRALSLVD